VVTLGAMLATKPASAVDSSYSLVNGALSVIGPPVILALNVRTARHPATAQMGRCEYVRSVGSMLPTVPAQSVAKPRSDKNRPSTSAVDSAQVRCSRYAESLVTACRQIDQSQDVGAAAAVPVVCR
jgi:hypothetical protein